MINSSVPSFPLLINSFITMPPHPELLIIECHIYSNLSSVSALCIIKMYKLKTTHTLKGTCVVMLKYYLQVIMLVYLNLYRSFLK